MYVCTYVYIYIHNYMYVCVCLYIYICIHMSFRIQIDFSHSISKTSHPKKVAPLLPKMLRYAGNFAAFAAITATSRRATEISADMENPLELNG